MTCSQLNISEKRINSYKVQNGEVHFFTKYCVIEINEGANVNFENSLDIIKLLYTHYGDGRAYGIIVNRINSYSIDLLDMYKFKSNDFPPTAYAIVATAKNASEFFELENRFCHANRKKFEDFFKAEQWVLDEINLKPRNLSAV